MKKLVSAMLVAVMMIMAVTACSTSPAPNTVFSVDDLEGKKIGVQMGTTGAIFADDVKDATVEKYNKGVDAVQALKQGKIDAVIIDSEPAKVFVSKNDDLMMLEEDFAVEDYAIAVAKDNTKLRDDINGALSQIKANGTLESIMNNWIGEDAGKTPYVTPEGTTYPNGKLVMATNAEFPPYESLDGENIVGIDVDMMRAVCDILGYGLSIENMEFDSVITAVQTGKAHVAVAGLTVTEDREKNVNFTDSYATSHQVIIVRNK